MKLSLQIFASLSLLFLSACNEEMSPLVAASVTYSTPEKKWIKKPLTEQQLLSLSVWLDHNSSNWSSCWHTLTMFTVLGVSLKHEDGSTSSLRLLNYTNSQTTLSTSYLSGSNKSDLPCAVQSFSQKDIDALIELLGVPIKGFIPLTSYEKEERWVPPDLYSPELKLPRKIRFKTTGEVVINPNFLSTWTSYPSK